MASEPYRVLFVQWRAATSVPTARDEDPRETVRLDRDRPLQVGDLPASHSGLPTRSERSGDVCPEAAIHPITLLAINILFTYISQLQRTTTPGK